MYLHVNIAESLLKAMVTVIVSTVQENVMRMPDGRSVHRMQIKNFDKILMYNTTMAAMRKMLASNLITVKEYATIEQKIAEKYGLENSVIYR